MFHSLEWVIAKLLNGTVHIKTDEEDLISKKEITQICRKFMDKVAMTMIINEFEDERIIQALLHLARIERIIIAFNVVDRIELSVLASLLDTNLNSIYAQKSSALKRLKAELEKVE